MRPTPLILVATILSGCHDPFTKAGQTTPEFYYQNVKGYGETVAGLPPDTVLAYGLVIEGDVARWRECTSVDECGTVERTRPSREVLAVERIAQSNATVAGEKVDVVKLSLAARPNYVVPSKPVR